MRVDLNLGIGETYECPYSLGYRRFEPEYFAVIHSGEGDGWDVHRPCMSSIITYQGRIYLIDAGPNLANSMAALGISIDQVDGIFHTHAHDDHFAGLTTLMQAGKRISYFATALVRASTTRKLSALMGIQEKQFPDFFDIRDIVADEWNNVEGLEVMPVFSPHPVETNILFFRALWGGGYRSYAHLADIASMEVLRGMVTDQPDAPGMDEATFNRVRSSYLTPVDVKKIDIGGGLIHGNVKDFRADASARILLAHRAGELTLEEKEIGSSASFGTVDVLVRGESEPMRHPAFGYLATHLPGLPLHELRLLLNHPIAEINPGAIVLKEGETPADVLLLVSGRVERIRTRDSVFGTMSPGSLIGGAYILERRPSLNTYRASSFLRVIRIPGDIYAEVIRRNGLLELIRRTATLLSFLDSTPLFGEGLPPSALSRIVASMKERVFKRGHLIQGLDLKVLNIVRSGLVERVVDDSVLGVLGERDFFGEEGAVFDVPYLSSLRVREDAAVVQIPGDILRSVPLLCWRLFDSYQRRVARAVYGGDPDPLFIWRDTFSSQVAEIDAGHQRLIARVNAILIRLREPRDRDALRLAFDDLVSCARDHFAAEEGLMALHDYPETRSHSRKHNELLSQLTDHQQSARRDGNVDPASFRYFFESWLVRHVLYDDQESGSFLSAQRAQ